MSRCRRFESVAPTLADTHVDPEFEAHVVGCRTCAALLPLRSREIAAMFPSAYGANDVAIRRLRQRLLGDLATTPPVPVTRRPSRRRTFFVVGVTGAAVAATLMFWLATAVRREAPVGFLAAVLPADSAAAIWSQRQAGTIEEIKLQAGTFRVVVKDHPTDRHVVFRLPDGEIEDIGTVFDVVVGAGRTSRVAVESGRVALRLRDSVSMSLSSGSSWNRPVDVLSRPPASGKIDSREATPTLHGTHRPRSISVPLAEGQLNDAGVRSASEDLAYLRVIRLVRDSRMAEARTAAVDYLRHFPNGFRSEEMRALCNQYASEAAAKIGAGVRCPE